jgi:N-acetyl-D-muramate 6-phosphate phosphatase
LRPASRRREMKSGTSVLRSQPGWWVPRKNVSSGMRRPYPPPRAAKGSGAPDGGIVAMIAVPRWTAATDIAPSRCALLSGEEVLHVLLLPSSWCLPPDCNSGPVTCRSCHLCSVHSRCHVRSLVYPHGSLYDPAMQALLFDLDGTLVDSVPLWIEANLRALRARDVVMDEQTFLTTIYQHGMHYHGILEQCGVSTEGADQFYQERNDLFDMLLRQKAQWIGDAETALQECAKQVPLGLMTGSARRFIDAMDSRLHLSKLFRALVTYDDTGVKMKPDPYGLLLLAETIGIDPTDCVYVGDQLVDVQGARAAGMKSCLIPSTYTPKGTEHEADIVLHNIGEIISLLDAV